MQVLMTGVSCDPFSLTRATYVTIGLRIIWSREQFLMGAWLKVATPFPWIFSVPNSLSVRDGAPLVMVYLDAGVKPWASHIPGMCYTTELNPAPLPGFCAPVLLQAPAIVMTSWFQPLCLPRMRFMALLISQILHFFSIPFSMCSLSLRGDGINVFLGPSEHSFVI